MRDDITREEKLHWLNVEIQNWEDDCKSKHPIKEALYAARKALEQEPCSNCIEFKRYAEQMGFELEQESKTDILDKIRAEIAELRHYYPMGHDYQIAITCCIAVIDKYKAEREGE